jgi:hypothetical protein
MVKCTNAYDIFARNPQKKRSFVSPRGKANDNIILSVGKCWRNPMIQWGVQVLYNIFIEFGIPTKLVKLIKICLNETYSKVCIRKYLSDSFPIQNGLKQGDAFGLSSDIQLHRVS